MKCKNDDNKMLAFGLCRKCYDATPEQKARRKEYLKQHPDVYFTAAQNEKLKKYYSSYRNSIEFKEYVKKFKETKEYKEWKNARNRFRWLTKDEVYKNERKEQIRKAVRKYRQGGVTNDNQTPSRRNTGTNDKKIHESLNSNS